LTVWVGKLATSHVGTVVGADLTLPRPGKSDSLAVIALRVDCFESPNVLYCAQQTTMSYTDASARVLDWDDLIPAVRPTKKEKHCADFYSERNAYFVPDCFPPVYSQQQQSDDNLCQV
jgi:hypothetical protein